MNLKQMAEKANWKKDEDGFYFCHCGEELDGVILAIIQKQYIYCDKCRDTMFIRNLSSDEFVEVKDVKAQIDFLNKMS